MIAEAGTRIPTRICRLDKEWELLAKDAQDDMRTSRNKVLGDNANTQFFAKGRYCDRQT